MKPPENGGRIKKERDDINNMSKEKSKNSLFLNNYNLEATNDTNPKGGRPGAGQDIDSVDNGGNNSEDVPDEETVSESGRQFGGLLQQTWEGNTINDIPGELLLDAKFSLLIATLLNFVCKKYVFDNVSISKELNKKENGNNRTIKRSGKFSILNNNNNNDNNLLYAGKDSGELGLRRYNKIVKNFPKTFIEEMNSDIQSIILKYEEIFIKNPRFAVVSFRENKNHFKHGNIFKKTKPATNGENQIFHEIGFFIGLLPSELISPLSTGNRRMSNYEIQSSLFSGSILPQHLKKTKVYLTNSGFYCVNSKSETGFTKLPNTTKIPSIIKNNLVKFFSCEYFFDSINNSWINDLKMDFLTDNKINKMLKEKLNTSPKDENNADGYNDDYNTVINKQSTQFSLFFAKFYSSLMNFCAQNSLSISLANDDISPFFEGTNNGRTRFLNVLRMLRNKNQWDENGLTNNSLTNDGLTNDGLTNNISLTNDGLINNSLTNNICEHNKTKKILAEEIIRELLSKLTKIKTMETTIYEKKSPNSQTEANEDLYNQEEANYKQKENVEEHQENAEDHPKESNEETDYKLDNGDKTSSHGKDVQTLINTITVFWKELQSVDLDYLTSEESLLNGDTDESDNHFIEFFPKWILNCLSRMLENLSEKEIKDIDYLKALDFQNVKFQVVDSKNKFDDSNKPKQGQNEQGQSEGELNVPEQGLDYKYEKKNLDKYINNVPLSMAANKICFMAQQELAYRKNKITSPQKININQLGESFTKEYMNVTPAQKTFLRNPFENHMEEVFNLINQKRQRVTISLLDEWFYSLYCLLLSIENADQSDKPRQTISIGSNGDDSRRYSSLYSNRWQNLFCALHYSYDFEIIFKLMNYHKSGKIIADKKFDCSPALSEDLLKFCNLCVDCSQPRRRQERSEEEDLQQLTEEEDLQQLTEKINAKLTETIFNGKDIKNIFGRMTPAQLENVKNILELQTALYRVAKKSYKKLQQDATNLKNSFVDTDTILSPHILNVSNVLDDSDIFYDLNHSIHSYPVNSPLFYPKYMNDNLNNPNMDSAENVIHGSEGNPLIAISKKVNILYPLELFQQLYAETVNTKNLDDTISSSLADMVSFEQKFLTNVQKLWNTKKISKLTDIKNASLNTEGNILNTKEDTEKDVLNVETKPLHQEENTEENTEENVLNTEVGVYYIEKDTGKRESMDQLRPVSFEQFLTGTVFSLNIIQSILTQMFLGNLDGFQHWLSYNLLSKFNLNPEILLVEDPNNYVVEFCCNQNNDVSPKFQETADHKFYNELNSEAGENSSCLNMFPAIFRHIPGVIEIQRRKNKFNLQKLKSLEEIVNLYNTSQEKPDFHQFLNNNLNNDKTGEPPLEDIFTNEEDKQLYQNYKLVLQLFYDFLTVFSAEYNKLNTSDNGPLGKNLNKSRKNFYIDLSKNSWEY